MPLVRPSSRIVKARGRVTSGDITLPNVGSTWTQVSGLTFSLPAAVGDYVWFQPTLMMNPPGATFLDVAVKVSTNFVRFASSDAGAPSTDGDPGMYKDAAYILAGGGVMEFVVESGDLDGSNVVFAIVHKGTGSTSILHASTNYPLRWRAVNFGPA